MKPTDNFGGPKVLGKFCLLFAYFLISLFSVLILSLCVGLVGLVGTVKVCEINNLKESN